MTTYILRRTIQAIPILIGISIVVFAIVYLAPGDPTVVTCDDANPCTVDSCDSKSGCQTAPGNAGAVCRAAAGACDLKNALSKAVKEFDIRTGRQAAILLMGDGESAYNPVSNPERFAVDFRTYEFIAAIPSGRIHFMRSDVKPGMKTATDLIKDD